MLVVKAADNSSVVSYLRFPFIVETLDLRSKGKKNNFNECKFSLTFLPDDSIEESQ